MFCFLKAWKKWFCEDKILLAAPLCRSCVGLTKSSTGSSSLLALCPDLLHPTLFLLLVQTNNSQNTNTSEFFVPRKAAVCGSLQNSSSSNCIQYEYSSFTRLFWVLYVHFRILPVHILCFHTYNLQYITIHCNALHYIYTPLYYMY